MEYLKLNNNIQIPALGFGTYRLKEKSEVENSLITALEIGYTSIDTAAIYDNEKEIGEAIKVSGFDRKKLFITTKVWNSEQGFAKTKLALEQSLEKLQTDYLDLYLIHWAVKGKYLETWAAMEEILAKGYAKSIGVCNFQVHHLKDLISNSKIKPAINQIELHPYLSQSEIREYCKQNNILVESWSPIFKGNIGTNKLILELAQKYSKTPTQIALRWHLDNGLIAIPKSSNTNRIKENFDIFDFKLENSDIEKINELNQNKRIGPDPDNFNF